MTQEQFAERSGFTQQYLSGLENGRRNPTIVSIYELAQALGVDHVALVAPYGDASGDEPPPRRKPSSRKAVGSRSVEGPAKRVKAAPEENHLA